jgi:RNA polymerase sigma-70 factor (ECF subfamily)
MIIHGRNREVNPSVVEYSSALPIIPVFAGKFFFCRRGNKSARGGVVLLMDDSAPNAPAAFAQMTLPHLDAAYNLARWLLRHDQDAEDAVQDAFLRAHQAFARFSGTDARAWLLTIVRNVCYTRLREQRRAGSAEEFDDGTHGEMLDFAESNAVAWREVRSELLRQALDRLAPEFREVIVLHEIEGLSYRDIAAIAKLPMGTVMSRLARARQKLQTELAALAGRPSLHGL